MLRTGSGSLVICPRIRENLTMENGDAAASWKDPASCLLDNGRNAGKCRQWRSCRTPGAPCIVLPFIPEIREMLPMENFLLHRSQRPFFLPFVPEIRDIFAMENGSRDQAQAAACWNRCITWSTDGQWNNGGWRSPLMQSSRTSDPG